MNSLDWLSEIEKAVKTVLEQKMDILENWRKHGLTRAKNVKDFEGWLLVELVKYFIDKKCGVRTNGCFDEYNKHGVNTKEMKEHRKEYHLKGRKEKSGSISPDIAVHFPEQDFYVDIEIKTQGGPQTILDDLKIVTCFNKYIKDENYRSCFLWVVIAPMTTSETSANKYLSALKRKLQKQEPKIQEEIKLPQDFEYVVKPWLGYCVQAPGLEASK